MLDEVLKIEDKQLTSMTNIIGKCLTLILILSSIGIKSQTIDRNLFYSIGEDTNYASIERKLVKEFDKDKYDYLTIYFDSVFKKNDSLNIVGNVYTRNFKKVKSDIYIGKLSQNDFLLVENIAKFDSVNTFNCTFKIDTSKDICFFTSDYFLKSFNLAKLYRKSSIKEPNYDSGKKLGYVFLQNFNVIYSGVETPIFVNHENKFDTIILKSNSGKIHYKDGGYYYYADRIGTSSIDVFGVSKLDTFLIGSDYFRIKELATPNIYFVGMGKVDKYIKRSLALSGKTLTANITNSDFSNHVYISEFDMEFKHGKETKKIHSDSNNLTQDMLLELLKVQTGDFICFTNIVAKYEGKIFKKIETLSFEIL